MDSQGSAVSLRLQRTRPVLGKNSVEHDKVANVLNSGNKEHVLPVLQHLSAAGKATIESLQVTECIGRLLRHKQPEVAAAAADAMGMLGSVGQRHQEAIAALLNSNSDACVMAALVTIGRIGSSIEPQRKPLVIKQVSDCLVGRTSRTVPVRVTALRTLAELKATRQALMVSEVLEQERVPEVRGAAVEALAKLSSLTWEAQSCFPRELHEPLIGEMLRDSRSRYSALLALYHLGSQAPASLLPLAAEALGDEDVAIRQAAGAALGGMAELAAESTETVSQLQAKLRSSDAKSRAAAASALAAMGPAAISLADIVAGLVHDMEEADVHEVMTSAGKRVPPQMRLPRCAALMALGRMGAADHVDTVSQGLMDRSWQVRVAAADSLAMLGEDARAHSSTLAGCLLDDAYPVRIAVCRAIGAVKAPEALPGLAQAFEDSSHLVRSAALDAAAELVFEAEEYCHEIFKLTQDKSDQVRASAVKALSRHPEMGAHYASVVAASLTDISPDVRAAGLIGLSHLGAAGRSYMDEVAACTEDPSEKVRQAAIRAQEKLGFRQPTMLKPLAAFENPSAAKAAMAGPRGIKDPVEGLGQYYKSIMLKKSQLEKSGRWVENGLL